MKCDVSFHGLNEVLEKAEQRGFARALDWLNAMGLRDAADALALEWLRRNPPETPR